MTAPLKLTLRYSTGNVTPSGARVCPLFDSTGRPAPLFTPADFQAAQRDPRAASQLQRDRLARSLQIQAAAYQVALAMIADIEALEGGWGQFDVAYAKSLHKAGVAA